MIIFVGSDFASAVAGLVSLFGPVLTIILTLRGAKNKAVLTGWVIGLIEIVAIGGVYIWMLVKPATEEWAGLGYAVMLMFIIVLFSTLSKLCLIIGLLIDIFKKENLNVN
jgi:hypothetical protein